MSNKSIIDEAIEQMQQKKADSRGKRTGDYRIGLDAAINILENLRDIHKEEIVDSIVQYQINHYHIFTEQGILNIVKNAETYYNETFNSKEDAKG
jgi:predicted SprT family Zn-dependent metalloprotease